MIDNAMDNKILTSIIAFLMIFTVNGNVINTDLTFDSHNIQIETINDVSVVTYVGLNNSKSTNGVSLPYKHLNIRIPINAIDVKISRDLYSPISLSLPAPLDRSYDGKITSNVANIEETKNVGSDLKDDGFFYIDGLLEGNERYLCLDITPFEYDYLNNTHITMFERMTVNISYELDTTGANNVLSPLSRRVIKAKRTVAIPSDLEDSTSSLNDAFPPTKSIYKTNNLVEGFEYTIITTAEMAPAFQKLVSLKKQKGIDAGIVNIEDILAAKCFEDGDVISGINDSAGKLRAYITYIYENLGARFVLLGGTGDIIPFRYGTDSMRNSDVPHKLHEFSIPTDMYYSDLTSNWNHRKLSEDFGFSIDNIDYMPEIFVGRILCSNCDEVSNYVDKLESYEFNPGNGDISYLGVASGLFAGDFHKEEPYIDAELDKFGVEYANYYQYGLEESPKGRDVIVGLNKVKPGIVYFHGHGNPQGFQTAYKTYSGKAYGINALDREYRYHEPESGNGLDNLTNIDKYFISYSISCTTMPYDNCGPCYGDAPFTYNFGQSIINGKNYGAVAYLGNTRIGYYSPSGNNNYSSLLETIFWRILAQGNISIGEAEAYSKSPLYCGSNLSHSHHLRLTHNLLGDPSLVPWIGMPKINSLSINFSDKINLNSLSQNGLKGMSIVDYQLNSGRTHKYLIGQKDMDIPIKNNSICIFGNNYLPIFFPLKLQDISLDGYEYLHCTDLLVGKNVILGERIGNVSFENDSFYYFSVVNNAILQEGTVIKANSRINISSNGSTQLTGVVIENGANLEISCGSCILENVTLPAKSKIVIK